MCVPSILCHHLVVHTFICCSEAKSLVCLSLAGRRRDRVILRQAAFLLTSEVGSHPPVLLIFLCWELAYMVTQIHERVGHVVSSLAAICLRRKEWLLEAKIAVYPKRQFECYYEDLHQDSYSGAGIESYLGGRMKRERIYFYSHETCRL